LKALGGLSPVRSKEFVMKYLVLPVAIAAAALLSTGAQAAVITIGNNNNGNYAVDALSGKKSNVGTEGLNRFSETFDVNGEASSAALFPGPATPTQVQAQCGLTTAAIVTGGTYGYGIGTTANVNATPKDDKTCYAYGPGSIGALPDGTPAGTLAAVTVDYGNLLETFPSGTFLNYFGLYYGSIDKYNKIDFFDGVSGTGNKVATVTGQDILGACGTNCNGDQFSEATNIYVNLFFSQAEQFRSFTFSTTGIAVEIDNLSVGVNIPTPVPEPASLALLGAGLAALGLSRRRKARK
jgi:hypothetical protein